MSANEKTKDVIFEQLSVDKNQDEPSVSFLDNLDASTLKIVELIMVAGTGQKDIINRFRTMHQRTGDFNAA
ncbi:hypothetical protein ACFLZ5_01750 [Thermodesulfobacteriota bacterium]